MTRRRKRLADHHVTDNLANGPAVRRVRPGRHVRSAVLANLDETIAEVRRILKPDGKYLVTVPYDLFLYAFFILFNSTAFTWGTCGEASTTVPAADISTISPKAVCAQRWPGMELTLKRVFVVNGLLLYGVAGETARSNALKGLNG